MNSQFTGLTTCVRTAVGLVLSQRRRALGMSLLDLNRQTDVPFLLPADLERGRGAPCDRDAFSQLLEALRLAGPCDVLWQVALGPHWERPVADKYDQHGRRQTIAEAIQRFLHVARLAEPRAFFS